MFPRNRILSKTIDQMVNGDVFYTSVGSVIVDTSLRAWLEKSAVIFSFFDQTTPIKVVRENNGFIVDISKTSYMWAPINNLDLTSVHPIMKVIVAND